MIDWLKLNDEQRKRTIIEVEYVEGIRSKAIEKDWWVTLTLKALFSGAYKNDLLFKGGTSLSKCWKLIHRFSEDIDIAIDPKAFGEMYQENPSKNFVKKLRRLGCEFTSTKLKEDLEKQFELLGLTEGTVEVYAAEVDPTRPDTDPQTLFVKYRSLYAPNPYLEDVVKIEVSTRYLKEPSSKVAIQSLLNEFGPNEAYPETPFEVTATEAHRTFLEKVFLLHEEFSRPEQKDIRSKRMSRHLYDLVKMADAGIATKALEDQNLYAAIIQHRKHYSMLSYMDDYNTLEKEKVSFVVPNELTEAYESDYKIMQGEMIYKEAPSFEELIEKLKQLTYKIRPTKNPPIEIIPAERPNYKFYKNHKAWKPSTWRVDLLDHFKYIMLHNIDVIPADAKFQLTLNMKIENENVADENYTFPLSTLKKGAVPGSDTLFFMIDNQNPSRVELKPGRSWVTYTISGDKELENYDLVLNCDYSK